MTKLRCALVLAAVSIAMSAAARPASELVVTGDGIVPVTVNGVRGRIRIDPGAATIPLLNTHYANRAQLKAGPFGFASLVGKQQVPGVTAVTRIGIGIGGTPRRRRVGWTERPYFTGADASVGPGGVPQQVVRFALRPSQPGERTISLPMVDEGGLFGGWGGVYGLIRLGGAPLRVRFNPYHPETLATASAGVRIAAAHGGRIGGESRLVPIVFGIGRPVRTLRLDRPLQVGPLAITTLGVRTADYGSTAAIREENADPEEIVVTGKRKRNTNFDRLWIGADQLARCSSLLFDKRARRISLTCA